MNLTNKGGLGAARGFWIAFGVIVAVMLALFWRGFLPGFVHFSNDGPLGAQMVEWLKFPDIFMGSWITTNTVGSYAGSYPLGISGLIRWATGPLGFSKFYVPLALLILGGGAWCFFRQIGLPVVLATVAALAVALNSSFLTSACWGVGSQEICYGVIFLSLALLTSASKSCSGLARWSRIGLAGMCVGMAVMEGADIGAIFSLLTAAYILFEAFFNAGRGGMKPKLQGVLCLAVVSAMAAFLAAQTVNALIGFAIKGVAVVESEEQSPAQKWAFATQWSMPKKETVAIAVPGVFGYRLDSPEGANYWGMIGSDLSWDQYFASGSQGTPPPALARFSGNGYYAGILVLLVAAWALFQAFRRQDTVFSLQERRRIFFWSLVVFVALLLSWGRFAPFYKVVYSLPYFSTIRNPTKYLFVMSFALTILFAYGLNGLWKRYVAAPGVATRSWGQWWASLKGADRKWAVGCLMALALAVIGAFIYTTSSARLVEYLSTVGFGDGRGNLLAKAIAAFSIKQVWIFVALFAVAVGLLFFVLRGGFAGRRTRGFAIALGVFVVIDLGRAAMPFIVHWDYREKYDLNLKNPVIEFFREKPYEHRMTMLPFPMPEQFELLGQVYRIEWAQHHFLYHNIQSLDVIQMPRMPADMMAFEKAWTSRGTPGLLRRWELTNTRYLLGPAGIFEMLNQQLDPEKKRFSVKLPFAIEPKPGHYRASKLDEFTAVANPNGPYAIGEFRGALPRAKLYSNWIINTNSAETLTNLFNPEFDPHKSVIVADSDLKSSFSTNDPGSVEITSYAPKRITLKADANETAILLLNDRYDSNWFVSVDGRPATLLRCNFFMRGVEVPPGQHTVEFTFQPTRKWIYVSIAAYGVAALLLGIAGLTMRRERDPEN